MPNKKRENTNSRPGPRSMQPPGPRNRRKWWATTAAIAAALAGAIAAIVGTNGRSPSPASSGVKSGSAQPAPAVETLELATAVMVTVELDFGSKIPGVADALRQIERRYLADEGHDRTFAILDAYGEPAANGKLHLSMHVSGEKPGLGSLVFRRTGEVLWQSRIVQGSKTPSSSGNLGIYIENPAGQALVVDGSNNPASVLDAMIQGANLSVRDAWPEGAEREVTFIYSACGCPVKVMARRVGERTVRAKELPVIFPDDPAVVNVIARLMGW